MDEDAMDWDLINALRLQGIDVVSVQEMGTQGFSNNQQLEWATAKERVIYSHNIGDFCRLHSEYLQLGRNHAGIVLIPQNTTIGDQARAIAALVSQRTSEDIQNNCIFLKQFL
jgi:hypothetical protein